MIDKERTSRKDKSYSRIQELSDMVHCLQRAQAHTRGQMEENQSLILQKLSAIEHQFRVIACNSHENRIQGLEN